MDKKSVERYILLGLDEDFTGIIEKKLKSSGIWRCVFAILILGFGIWTFAFSVYLDDEWRPFLLTIGDIVNPIPFVLAACSIPFLVRNKIRKIHRRVEEISNGINTDRVKPKNLGSIGAGAVGMLISRAITEAIPGSVPFLLFLVIWFITFFLLMRAVDRLYKVHLIRAYCPYLITPADKRYNDDLYGEKSDKT